MILNYGCGHNCACIVITTISKILRKNAANAAAIAGTIWLKQQNKPASAACGNQNDKTKCTVIIIDKTADNHVLALQE